MNPINVTGYDRDAKIDAAADEFLKPLVERVANLSASFLLNQRPGGQRKMKIHQVVNESTGEVIGFIRAHTRAGAERYAANKIKPTITATVATQEDLVKYLTRGGKIEDATNSPQASIPEPAQTQE